MVDIRVLLTRIFNRPASKTFKIHQFVETKEGQLDHIVLLYLCRYIRNAFATIANMYSSRNMNHKKYQCPQYSSHDIRSATMNTLHHRIHRRHLDIHWIHLQYTVSSNRPLQGLAFEVVPVILRQLPLLLSSLNFVQHFLPINSTRLNKAFVFIFIRTHVGLRNGNSTTRSWLLFSLTCYWQARVKVVNCGDFWSWTGCTMCIAGQNIQPNKS